jgi:hypothetical protein
MSLSPKELVKGKKYLIWITGIVRKFVAECVGHDDQMQWGLMKVLNNDSSWKDTVLKREDYIPLEEYDPVKHGEY